MVAKLTTEVREMTMVQGQAGGIVSESTESGCGPERIAELLYHRIEVRDGPRRDIQAFSC